MKVDPDHFDPKTLRDHFTDRNQEIHAFEEALRRAAPIPVLMYYGVGGTGKTFLLRYLLNRSGYFWSDSPEGYPHAFLTFRPGQTQFTAPEALSQAKWQLEKILKGIVFTRFKILWGKWWEKTHGMPISQNKDLLAEEASAITELLLEVFRVSFAGGLVKVIELGRKGARKVQASLAVRAVEKWFEEQLQPSEGVSWKSALESLDGEELTQLVAKGFAADLADAATKLNPKLNRIILFLDTYENLEEHLEGQTSFVQVMAEELIRQRANVLLVIAGRDMLHWGETWQRKKGIWISKNPEESIWAEKFYYPGTTTLVGKYLQQHLVGEFSEKDAMDYLFKRDVKDLVLAKEIVRFTAGYPLALGVAADLLGETKKSGKQALQNLSDRTIKYEPLSEEWREETVDWLVARLFEQLRRRNNTQLVTLTKMAAVPRWFNSDLLFSMDKDYGLEEKFEELSHYSFVEPYQVEAFQAFRLHAILRKLLLQQIGNKKRLMHWNQAALEWFEQQIERQTGSLRWQYELEILYHTYMLNPEMALSRFQKIAEQVVRLQQVDKLEGLLSDIKSYIHERESSLFFDWYKYYGARLMELQRDLKGAELVYSQIGNDSKRDVKLQAYALCDLANLLVRMENLCLEGGVEKALDTIRRSEQLGVPTDSKLILLYGVRHSIYNYKCKWDQSVAVLRKQIEWFESNDDVHGVIRTMHELRGVYAMMGDWATALVIYHESMDRLARIPQNTFLQARLRIGLNWALVWSGRYHLAELESRAGLRYAEELNNPRLMAEGLRELAHAISAQGRFNEANSIIDQCLSFYADLGELYKGSWAPAIGIKGLIQMQAGNLEEAKTALETSLKSKQDLQDNMGIPELVLWLGELAERQGELETAADYYMRYLSEYTWTGRLHFECEVYCGLVRIRFRQKDYDAIPPLLAKGEELARKNNYMEHMANLYLLRGHLAWNGYFNSGDRFEDALQQYQAALFYGLCFNRFLLDSLLDSPLSTILTTSIFVECRNRGDEGQRMLRAIQSWWERSELDELVSQFNVPGIPGNRSLSVFEADQRAVEPGDRNEQITLMDRIRVELEA